MHLLVPFAACDAPGCRDTLRTLALPHLERLLARLAPDPSAPGDERSLSMPHEREFAGACGLSAPDGLLPLAALEAAQAGHDAGHEGWAWITPCHWRVGTDHVFMQDPGQLQLGEGDSRALLAAMAPYFEQDGLVLSYAAPTRWLARGAFFARLPTASLDRVTGRVIDSWMPKGDTARPLRRLQQEMQMLLYTHPVTDERAGRGLRPVNSFWASGSGVLPPDRPAAKHAGLQLAPSLREPALAQDWPAWGGAWQQLDGLDCAGLQRALDDGTPVSLTLCGERRARTWRSAKAGWRQRLAGAFSRQSAFERMADL